MAIRVLAIAAPENPRGILGKYVLKSGDPASLYNACRYAGSLAAKRLGPWGDSNWSTSRLQRQQSTILMHSWYDEMSSFEDLLLTERPNVLLIGAMSICLPGAIRCARRAKEVLGDNHVCVVLGGRHASESIYLNSHGHVCHHASSPLQLMALRQIDSVFDAVISGEGECIIPWIGSIVDYLDNKRLPVSSIFDWISDAESVPGRWILGCVTGDKILTAVGRRAALDLDLMPPPCEVFGIRAAFEVFGGRPTAHVFSDTGNGCAFDCSFCSERRSVTGPLAQLNTSANRLFRQLAGAVQVVKEDSPGHGASAFIEDSTILAGSIPLLGRLAELLESSGLDIRFGGQLTIDQVASRFDILRRLKSVGLDYLFIGIETLDPNVIGGISKDVRSHERSWADRIEHILESLASLNIKCGAAILFGLGESHHSRLRLIERLAEWRRRYNAPLPVSLNWAVQHPLKGEDGGTGYDYVGWACPDDDWLEAFSDFGEASVLYPIAGQPPPVLHEVTEVAKAYRQIMATDMT